MHNPYRIEGPACIAFSGGRTSGYMLKHILDAHGGTLPPDVHCYFANTGKEMPETLEFVAECGERWGVKIEWVEYAADTEGRTREVSFSTASRNGEPFEALIAKKNFLPNPVMRMCSAELKVKPMIVMMRDIHGYEHWDNAVGLRADEPRRVAKTKANDARERYTAVMPLAEAGVTKHDIVNFWAEQEFDLRLPNFGGVTPAGNCDLCFLKGARTLSELIREKPELADWWIGMEHSITNATGSTEGTFRSDRPPYRELKRLALAQETLPFPDDDSMPCMCTE